MNGIIILLSISQVVLIIATAFDRIRQEKINRFCLELMQLIIQHSLQKDLSQLDSFLKKSGKKLKIHEA